CHRASSLSKNGRNGKMPALLTHTSSRPCFSATRLMVAVTAAASVTSSATPSAPAPPRSRIAAAVASALSALASATITVAPASARRNAVAWPMPRPPPVTIATLPVSPYSSASGVAGGVIASSLSVDMSASFELGFALLDEGARPFLGVFRREDGPADLQLLLERLDLGQPLGLHDRALDRLHR